MWPLLDVKTPEGKRLRNVRPVDRADGSVSLVGKAGGWPIPVEQELDRRVVIVVTAPGPVEVEGKGRSAAYTLGGGFTGTKSGGCGCGMSAVGNAAKALEGT